MNPCHTWKLYCSPLKILVELGDSQNKLPYPCRKKNPCQIGSSQVKRKLTRIMVSSWFLIDLKFEPEVGKHVGRFHIKLQPNPTVELKIIIVTIKLDSCTLYIKMQIWPYLDLIIPSLFKIMRPWITNKLNGQFLCLFLEFFSYQQLSPTTLDESSSCSISYIIIAAFFSSLSEACWVMIAAVNTSTSWFISPRIWDRLLDSFFRTLISLFLSLWYHISF